MYLGIVWGVTLIALGLVTVMTALQIVLAAMWPAGAERARAAAAGRPVVAGLLGTALLGGTLLVTIVLGQLGAVGQLLALVVGLGALLPAFLGWSGVSLELGRRILGTSDAPASRAILRGSVATSLVGVGAPFLGWFFVLPACLAVATGALVLGPARGVVGAPVAPSAPAPAA